VRESDVAGVEKLKSFRVAETENGRERKTKLGRENLD